MTIRQLHLLGSPVLRQAAAPVAAVDDEVRRLVAKWKKARKGKPGYVKDVTPEPAGEL